mmetsp:Transcript_6326/g.17209  ORF Transcript_6326/g.17209 Transcript_6326/m.17209 type:complete len:244 (-) Transcript_6326:55-786(-)
MPLLEQLLVQLPHRHATPFILMHAVGTRRCVAVIELTADLCQQLSVSHEETKLGMAEQGRCVLGSLANTGILQHEASVLFSEDEQIDESLLCHMLADEGGFDDELEFPAAECGCDRNEVQEVLLCDTILSQEGSIVAIDESEDVLDVFRLVVREQDDGVCCGGDGGVAFGVELESSGLINDSLIEDRFDARNGGEQNSAVNLDHLSFIDVSYQECEIRSELMLKSPESVMVYVDIGCPCCFVL